MLGSQTATTIVNTDTNALINKANDIIMGCTGTNCNVSDTTRRQITEQLSTLSQQQSNNTLSILSIPSSSVLAREIYIAYINLAAAIASVYNFQCGASTTNNSCVINASSVKNAQNTLQSLLVSPANNEINHITAASILFSLTIIAFLLFFIFLLIGLVESIVETAITPQYIVINQPSTPVIPVNQQTQPSVPISIAPQTSPSIIQPIPSEPKIPVPVSPFTIK